MRPEEANPLIPRGFGAPKFPEDVQVFPETGMLMINKCKSKSYVGLAFSKKQIYMMCYAIILQNKFLANEDENAYVQLEVYGDPAPTAQWFRVKTMMVI